MYSLQVFEVPEGSRIAKGRAIINLLPLTPGEHVVKLLCARDVMEGKFIVMVTKKVLSNVLMQWILQKFVQPVFVHYLA